MGESIQSFLQQPTEQVFQVLRQREQWEGSRKTGSFRLTGVHSEALSEWSCKGGTPRLGFTGSRGEGPRVPGQDRVLDPVGERRNTGGTGQACRPGGGAGRLLTVWAGGCEGPDWGVHGEAL